MDHLLILISAAVFLIIGAGLGFLFGHFMPENKRKADKLAEELAETKAEMSDYKDQVANHYSETAALVNQMTESYKAVYAHLAKSSHELIDEQRLEHMTQLQSQAPEGTLRLADDQVAADESGSETVEAAEVEAADAAVGDGSAEKSAVADDALYEKAAEASVEAVADDSKAEESDKVEVVSESADADSTTVVVDQSIHAAQQERERTPSSRLN